MVSAPRYRPGARGLLTLLLLLPLPGARGLCGAPPTFSRAVHHDTSRTEGFPVSTEVTYRCRDGFFKIPGQSDTLVCLSNSEWSTIGEFCGPSCGAPPRLKSAALSAEDAKKNYSPPGTTVSYVCRPGYESTELRPVITCLENSTWSEAPEFCRGKSCGVPKGPERGRAVDVTNDRYGARLNIICDDGFRLRGRPFIQCMLKGDQVEWSQLPTCEGKSCGVPKGPEHGRAVDITNDRFGARVNIICDDGFRLRGRTFIQCMLKGDQVEWSQLPTCEALVIITEDKPTTVPPKGTEVAGTSSDSALNTIGHSTELEGPGIAGIKVGIASGIVGFGGVGIVDIITQDKPTTVPPKGTEVAGTSSVIITQDKPTTVPPKGTEIAGTSSGSALNTAGNSTVPEGKVIITQDKPTTVSPKGAEVAGTSSGSTLNTAGNSTVPEGEGSGIASISVGISAGIVSVGGVIGISITVTLIIQYQKKKSSYSVNPDSPKHQITTTPFQGSYTLLINVVSEHQGRL